MSRVVRALAVTLVGAAFATSARAGDPPLFPLPSSVSPGSAQAQTATGDVDGDGLVDLVSPNYQVLQVSRGRPDGSLGSVDTYPAPTAKTLVALGDVDGDGDLDAVTDISTFPAGSVGVQVLLNDGEGAFTSVFTKNLGKIDEVFDPLAVDDLDGDGLADIVVVQSVGPNGSTISALLATGGGQFAEPVLFPMTDYGYSVQTGDLDLDGDIDLALPVSLSIVQLRNAGDGSFVLGPTAPTTFQSLREFQLVDATGDGRLDAVYLCEFAPILAVLPGQPDGSFGAEVDVPLPFESFRARLAPIDDDALVDLAIVGYPAGTAVLHGLGELAFQEVQRLPLVVDWLTVADMNIDGRPDLLTRGDNATVVLAHEDGSFDTTRQLTVDEGLRDVALADLDGDGRVDLLEAHATPNVVQVKLQQTDGSFVLVQTLPALAGAELHPCHADSDGDIDLVVSSATGTSVVVALGVGDGTLTAFSAPITAGRDIQLADMNGDGRDDLVGWTQFSGYELRVTYGNGLGTFAGTTAWPSPVDFTQLAAADIDQDGRVDIIVGNGGSSSVLLKWVNTGTGLLLKSFNPSLVASSVDLRCADFNGDGDPDLLALPGKVCLGAPAAQFAAPVSLSSLSGSGLARVADIDSDGFDDALFAPSDKSSLHLVRGAPAGLSSAYAIHAGAGWDIQALAVGDVDGDGRLDIATAAHEDDIPDAGEDEVTILMHRAPGPFSDLGFALAGSEGEPALTGIGTLAGGTALSLRVTGTKPFAPTRLIVGAQLLQAPFKGGVLVPLPTLVLPPLPTNSLGQLILGTTWPSAVPSGLSLYAQAWITDAAGPAGFSATDGLQLTTP